MSDTPMTDKTEHECRRLEALTPLANLARNLERQLAEAQAENKQMSFQIQLGNNGHDRDFAQICALREENAALINRQHKLENSLARLAHKDNT